jgi:hypothetical protein
LIVLAGLPATIEFSETSLITTEPAPIIELLPILISPITTVLAPIVTLSPIIGQFPPSFAIPMVGFGEPI